MKHFVLNLNRNVKLALIITSLVLVWMFSGVFVSKDNQEAKTVSKNVKVLVKQIQQKVYLPEVQVVGRTQVSKKVDVVAEVSGKVEKVDFSQGDLVKQGDILAVLENSYRKDTLESASEALNAAKLKLDIAKDLSKNAYTAKTELADRQADYANKFSEYTNAKRDYENSFVKAPIAGFIESKSVNLGDYVKSDTVLYKIIAQDEMYLVGYLSQNQREKVKIGQQAYGIFNNGDKVNGVINFISQQADEVTKTYKMEVLVRNQNQDFKVVEGLTVKIFVPSEQQYVYEIPHSAMVIHDDGRLGIRTTDENNKVEFNEIKIVNDSHKSLLVQLVDASVESLELIIRGQIDVSAGMLVEKSYSDNKQEQKND